MLFFPGEIKAKRRFCFSSYKELLEQLPNAQVATPKTTIKPAPQPTAATGKKKKSKKKSNNNNHTISISNIKTL